MANRNTSHVASGLSDGRGAPGRFRENDAPPRRPYRLGGVLRWDADRAGGVRRIARRAVALTMAGLLTLLPVMETAVAAGRNAAAEQTRVAALAPIRLPLEVAPPAFTLGTAG